MKRKVFAVVLILTLIVGSFSTVTFGASKSKTKKMTVYSQVIKKGKYAYCCSAGNIYKVNLKKGTVKLLYGSKIGPYDYYWGGGASSMKIHKKYIYFINYGEVSTLLLRVKVTSGKAKKLSKDANDYAISRGKIYYNKYKNGKWIKRKIKLNGKGKTKSKYIVKNKHKKSNASGYKITTKEILRGEDYVSTDYLVTPHGKRIKLCSYLNPYK